MLPLAILFKNLDFFVSFILGFLIKIRKCLIFASIHPPHFPNQGQGSVFMLRECAESISRIKLPLGIYFLEKFSKNFFRRTGSDCYSFKKLIKDDKTG